MQNKKQEAVVVEDNGGGLTLYVFGQSGIDGGEVVYCHTGYEYNQGQLSYDIKGLLDGDDATTWDGCEDNPQSMWDDLDNYDASTWSIVARIYDGKLVLSPDLFGVAAKKELRFSQK